MHDPVITDLEWSLVGQLAAGSPPRSPHDSEHVLRQGPAVQLNTQGDGYESIEAWVFGEWAAHRRLSNRHQWDVTFLPAGMNITGAGPKSAARDLDESQAKRIADWLGCHVQREEMYDWSHPSAELVARILQGIEAFSTDLTGEPEES